MKNGYDNEFEFINSLNKKKFKELNILMQEVLEALFINIEDEDVIIAYKYGKYAKTDIVIKINEIEKGISIKYGSRNSVHLEPIEKFIQYLKKFNFQETDKLLRYLYSDGTNNNTGITRLSSEEYKVKNEKDIITINDSLNNIKDFLIRRFLIETDINYKIKVDAFIIGNTSDFIWATKDEVINYLSELKHESSSVHISSLYIQNWNKNLKYNPKYEYCRNYIQVKWYSMFDDIIKIMSNRTN